MSAILHSTEGEKLARNLGDVAELLYHLGQSGWPFEVVKKAAAALSGWQPSEAQIEAAAKVIAECMDYPWAHMPEQGRNSMRAHAKAVAAALSTPPAPNQGEAS
jgi:hypothetical protein